MNEKLQKAQDVFLDRINQICNKFGLNNIMAQLYAILYLSDKPLSLDDMVERLKISKASASVNIRALERYGAVRQVWVKGSRKDYYEAEEDVYKVIVERVRSMVGGRLSEVDEMIESSYGALNSVSSGGGEDDESVKCFKERLEKVRGLYEQGRSLYDLFSAFMAKSDSPEKAHSAVLQAGNASKLESL